VSGSVRPQSLKFSRLRDPMHSPIGMNLRHGVYMFPRKEMDSTQLPATKKVGLRSLTPRGSVSNPRSFSVCMFVYIEVVRNLILAFLAHRPHHERRTIGCRLLRNISSAIRCIILASKLHRSDTLEVCRLPVRYPALSRVAICSHFPPSHL